MCFEVNFGPKSEWIGASTGGIILDLKSGEPSSTTERKGALVALKGLRMDGIISQLELQCADFPRLDQIYNDAVASQQPTRKNNDVAGVVDELKQGGSFERYGILSI